MLLKLALHNIRRSVRDYAIYFITLVLGVAVFYAFNALGDSAVLFDLEAEAEGVVTSSGTGLFGLVSEIMAMFSVVVAAVLGFLVLYANRFVVRARKKEFGTYLLLGMAPRQVSAVVLAETLIVGAFSLAAGLALGVFASQGMSFATAAMLNVSLKNYQLVFSAHSFGMTLLCFAVVFLVVALFNTLQVSRCKLATLLSAHARTERMMFRNPVVCAVAFVLSLVLLACAYTNLTDNGMKLIDEQFFRATVLMLAGTLLLFFSAASFVVLVLKRVRPVYFKGLTAFTVQQVSSKMNTAFLSLWAICVLLFLSITVFSCGMGMADLFAGDLDDLAPYDATLTASFQRLHRDDEAAAEISAGGEEESARAQGAQAQDEQDARTQDAASEDSGREKDRRTLELYYANDGDTERYLASVIPDWESVVSASAQVDIWQDPHTSYAAIEQALGMTGYFSQYEETARQGLRFVGVSQYNDTAHLANKQELQLAEGEYAVCNTVGGLKGFADALAAKGTELTLCGVSLRASGEQRSLSLYDETTSSVAAVVVVPDEVVQIAKEQNTLPLCSNLNLQYASGYSSKDATAHLMNELGSALPPTSGNAKLGWTYDSRAWPVSYSSDRESIESDVLGIKLLTTYLALYIGFVFLVTTTAVLSVQQLSDVAESIPRYKMLARLGCDRRMIQGSLRTQIAAYFMAPLAVAVCHSVCAVSVVYSTMLSLYGVSTLVLLGAAALVLGVYLLYMVGTYLVARSTVTVGIDRRQ